MMQAKKIKYLKFVIFFISQFFSSQTIISFYDVTKYQDEDSEYILYNNEKINFINPLVNKNTFFIQAKFY